MTKSFPLASLFVFALAATPTAHSPAAEAPQRVAGRLEDLVDPSARPEKVADGFQFTEGPAWGPQGFLLFSDIPRNLILKLGADGKVTTFLEDSGGANGLIFDPRGRLYACQGGARRVVRIDVRPDGTRGEVKVLADSYGGKPLNSPNDIALDAAGGVWFTDPYYGAPKKLEQEVMGVYHVSPEGKVARVISDLKRPNGILVARPAALYVAEPDRRQIWTYRIGGDSVSDGKVLFTGDESLDGGGPDGMALDERGNIWASYKGIVVLSPQGAVLGRIPVPEQPANCEIGGPDGKTLFITARKGLYRLPLKVRAAPLLGPKE